MKTYEQIALEVLEDFDLGAYSSKVEMMLDFLRKVDKERARTGLHPYPIDKAQLKRLVTQVFGEGYQIIPPSPTTPHVAELEMFASGAPD